MIYGIDDKPPLGTTVALGFQHYLTMFGSTLIIPMILAGRGGGCVRTGRLAEHWGRRNGDLFASLAQAMGHRIDRFGQDSQGPLPGLVL